MKIRQSVWKGSACAALFLLPCHAAFADNGNSNAPASNNQGQPAFHPNLYKLIAPHQEEKAYGSVRENSSLQQNKSAGATEPNTGGLHWSTVDSHPGVGYQIDKNEEMRLHFGGHGAKASFALKF